MGGSTKTLCLIGNRINCKNQLMLGSPKHPGATTGIHPNLAVKMSAFESNAPLWCANDADPGSRLFDFKICRITPLSRECPRQPLSPT